MIVRHLGIGCVLGTLLVAAPVDSAPFQAVPPTGRYESRGIAAAFGSDRSVVFSNARGVLIVGTYRTDANRIEFRDESGPSACPGQTGAYRYRLAGDTLLFSLVSDECQGRRNALGAPWIRVRPALVLTHATLIDGTGAAPRAGMTIVMDSGVIVQVAHDAEATIPEGAVLRDASGMWVMPGLIDAHVHLATDPSGQDRRDRVERRLRNALHGGVVAVRDMAGDTRALSMLARDAEVGDIPSPTIRYAAVFAGPAFFTDPRVRATSAGVRIGTAPWARAITDTTNLQQAVAEARGTGASGIKLYAELSGPLATRIATEARRQHMMVWAHLTLFPARPGEVVASGVQVVSHAPLLAWEAGDSLPSSAQRAQYDLRLTPEDPAIQRVITLMRERDVLFEPTLWVFRAEASLSDTSLQKRRAKLAADLTRAAYQAGVGIVAGTDGIGGDEPGALPNIHEEIALLVERAGLKPMDALMAATRVAARAAGLDSTHGMVVARKAADLLVLRADPLLSIRNTREIAFVVQRGRVVER
jgi:hypothetical protein